MSAQMLAPWWTQEKCRRHQPYPNRQAADRAAALHPIHAARCWKCESQKIEVFKCYSGGHWHIGHGSFRSEEAIVFPLPVEIEAMRPKKRGGKPSKLNPVQVRQIFVQTQEGFTERDAKRIGEQYGVHFSTVYDIARGRTYGWATTDLRAALAARKQEGDTVQDMGTAPIVIDTSGQDGTPMHLSMPVAAAPALIADLADALELLLDIRDGKPLPKFVTLDADAIRALVEQARA